MNNYGVDIINFYCLDFNLSNKICVSSDLSYIHELTYETDTENSVTDAEVFLTLSGNSFKYSQEVLSTSGSKILFKTDPRTHELAIFDEVQLTLHLDNGTSIQTKKKINRVYIAHSSSILRYTTGEVNLPYSNMLYPRIKLGFPKWGSIEKNDISNGTKLLEPLLRPFYDSYHKIINFKINSKYKLPYTEYKSIFLGGAPTSVMRVNQDNLDTKVFEASSIQGIPKKVKLENNSKTYKLSRIIINGGTTEELDFVPFLNTTIYVKKLKWGDNQKHWLLIKGYDKYGDLLQDRIELLDDFYVSGIHKFSKIVEIDIDCSVILSNYLDCRFDHFLIKDINTAAPIVDSSLYAFFPKVLKTQNNSGTRDVLHIHNTAKELSEVAYKFDLEQLGRITSLYIDEHLRVYWTDGSKIYSSVFNHDLSKDIGKHVSNNNNSIVTVSDVNTCIGDWADVVIDTEAWSKNTPMVIQVKNKDSILYYDQETESFIEDIKYFYPKENERFIELSVKVMNEQAYIFSVFSDTLKQKYVASTHSNLLKSIVKDVDCTGTLLLVNGTLQIGSTFSDPLIKETNNTDRLYISVIPLGVNSFSWEYHVEGYSFNNVGGNLPEEYYEVKSGDGECNTPVTFEIDRSNLLKNFQVSSLTTALNISIDKLYNVNTTYQILVQIIDNNGTVSKTYVVDSTNESTKQIPITFTHDTKELKDAV